MIFCEETFNDFGKGMDDLVNAGTNMVELNTVFSNLLDVCNFHIDEKFPGGHEALENYYKEMPKDIMSYREFIELVKTTKEEYKEKVRKAQFHQLQLAADTPINSLKSSFAKILDAQKNDPELFQKYCKGQPILLNN